MAASAPPIPPGDLPARGRAGWRRLLGAGAARRGTVGRHRLASPTEHELTRRFARQHATAWLSRLLLALALTSAGTLWAAPAALAPWSLLAVAAALGMAVAARRFLGLGRREASVRTWRLGFALGELAQATAWLLFLVPVLGSGAPAAYAFALVAIILILGAVALVNALVPLCVYAGATPLAAATLLAALEARGTADAVMVLLTICAGLLLLYLAARLHDSAATVVRAEAQTRASLAELEHTRANSTEACRRLEEAELAKARFLATVSHELRTPLNAILGFSELMKNEVLGSHATSSYRDYSRDIHGSGQQLLTLIDEILDLSRMETGHYELDEEPVSLGAIVQDCVDAVASLGDAKGHAVDLAIDGSLLPLWGGRQAIHQIVVNLLSNAFKYTPPGGRVTVKVGWTGAGGQYVSIRDTGPGIPDEETALVMSSFGRGALARATAERGAGLGLPIAKGLADLHGAAFRLASKPGQGTEAVVIFPAARVLQEPAEGSGPAARSTAAA